jgi:hypothetical protein
VVQKVQPNDKSGKLLRNNHTKGAQESTRTPYVEGIACGVPQNEGEAPAVSLAFEPTCIPSATDLSVLLPIAHPPAKVAH